MKNKSLLVLGIVAIGAFVAHARWDVSAGTPAAAGSSAKTEWLTDFRAAQQRARVEKKPLLIDFTGSDWCPPCMLLEKQVFSQREFADYAARNLVVVRIDFPRRKPLPPEQQVANDDLAQRFAIEGFPTILVMSPEGKLKGQVGNTFGGAASFISEIEAIIRKS